LEALLGAAASTLQRESAGCPELSGVVRARLTAPRPLEVVIAGNPSDPRTRLLLLAYNRTWRPKAILGLVPPSSNVGERYSLLANRPPAPDGRPLAYVCRHGVCQLPVDTPEALERAL
jgi:uncharacterized protein YyaL (SSP411 family)